VQSAPPAAPPATRTLPGTVGGPALSGTPPARPPVVRTTPDARVTIARPDPAPPAAVAPPPTKPEAQRFKLEVLSYSDVPAQRLVFINGRRYREGEMLDGGVKVEEIHEDSVILSEAGQRFTLR
jgi:type II secretion system (T2SS) protein B